MAKLRLMASMKHVLMQSVTEHVKPDKPVELLKKLYDKALPLVLANVAKKYPATDMAVLKRYENTNEHDSLLLMLSTGGVVKFELTAPLTVTMPQRHYHQSILIDASTTVAVDAWQDANTSYKKEYEKRFAAYRALIQGATYLEDLLEVWPEAAAIVPRQGAIIALGPEQIEIIKRDRAERAAKEASK